MKLRRGATSLPIRIEKVLSASSALSVVTLNSFWDDEDSAHLSELHGVAGEEGVRLFDERNHRFKDERLNELLIHYKGRNFPRLLNSQEKTSWAEHCQKIKERDLPQIEENLKTLFTENYQDSSLLPLLKETEAYFQQYIYKEDS